MIYLSTTLNNANITSPSGTKTSDFIHESVMEIEDEKRSIIFQHPPSSMQFHVKIFQGAELRFGIGIDPLAWEKTYGVVFIVEAKAEKTQSLFSKLLNPRFNADDRRWKDFKIPLDQFANKEIDLIFRTDMGAWRIADFCWAGWSNPRIVWPREISPLIRDILACPVCRSDVEVEKDNVICSKCDRRYPVLWGVPIMFPDNDEISEGRLELSRNTYTTLAETIIKKSKLVLNCGAGYPPTAYPNVVELDLSPLPSTHICGTGESLPFKDEVFDGFISRAVIEHVKNPFAYANEAYRVLKKGGEIFVDSAFLQPLHAYPNHYFNTTRDGLELLFSAFKKTQSGVADYQHPKVALKWFLETYLEGLEEGDKGAIMEMTIKEVLKNLSEKNSTPLDRLRQRFQEKIACGVFFSGIKN